MQSRTRVLIVDDEYKTLELLAMRLHQDGFDVTTATSGDMGLKIAYETHPDAVLLDIKMPGMDGLQVCRRLREVTDAVIMFVTVRGGREDIIRGLYMGADDYIIKPYRYQELLARLLACLRRKADSNLPPLRLQRGEAVLIADPSRRLVFIEDGRSVQLTPKEFSLLKYLVQNRGKVLSADEILTNVWGLEYQGERDLVKQFIYRLRNKLEPDPSNPEYIVTVRGSGYALEEDTHPRMRPADMPRAQKTTPDSSRPQPVTPLIVPDQREPPRWAAEPLPHSIEPIRREHQLHSDLPHEKKNGRTWVRQMAVAMLIVILATFGMTTASGYALPGDVLYPVKTLLEDFQRVVVMDEVNEAQLHLRFAANRLEEVAALLAQERFDDIPPAMMGFESEMREAIWALVGVAGEGQPPVRALESLLDEDFNNRARVINDLMSKAPGEAQPAIDQAIGVLLEESNALKALLVEIDPENIPGEMAGLGSLEVQPEKVIPGSPVGQGVSQPTAIHEVLSATSYVQGTVGALEATCVVIGTQINLPTLISTLRATPYPASTSRVEPTSTRKPSITSTLDIPPRP